MSKIINFRIKNTIWYQTFVTNMKIRIKSLILKMETILLVWQNGDQ